MKYLLILLMLTAPFASFAKDKGRETGMPTPRFVSLKSSEVNMRKGPGTRYPIEWVYRRKGLPVEIMEEFGHWRRVRDSDGTSGWLHKQMVSGTRRALITSDEIIKLHEDPETGAPVTVKLEPGVIVGIEECELEWCLLKMKDYEGWAPKLTLYGAYDKELYNP